MPPRASVWLAVALLAAAVLVRIPFQVGVLALSLGSDMPCPQSPLHSQPTFFHFRPGLEAHQSWIEAPVGEPDATQFVLCLDGRLVDLGIGETPVAGVVNVSVRTTWVDVQWLLGALTAFEAPERWDVGYTTYTLENLRHH